MASTPNLTRECRRPAIGNRMQARGVLHGVGMARERRVSDELAMDKKKSPMGHICAISGTLKSEIGQGK